MDSNNIATIGEHWRASDEGDWQAAGRYIGDSYVWIDHATGSSLALRKDSKKH